jgi:colicin import membrane protein
MFLRVANAIGRGVRPAGCAALALAMGLGFAVLGCGDSSEPSGSQVESAPPAQESGASGLVETGRATAEQMGQKAERAATEAREAAGAAATEAQEAAGAAAEKVGEQAERVQQGAEGMAEDAGQKAQGLMDKAGKAMEEESGTSE